MIMGVAASIAREAVRASAASARQRQEQSAQDAQDAAKEAAAAAEREAEERAKDKLADRLDEAASLIRRHVWLTPAQADALALITATTWVTEPGTLVSAPRVLFLSPEPETGKSVALRVSTALSYNPVDVAGTWFDTKSAIFEASTAGDPCPTLFRDEVSQVFGRSGLYGSGNPLTDVLLRGYVSDAEIGRSVSQTSDKASIFSVVYMTGRRVAVPDDVKTRTITIHMTRAPEGKVRYFDLRGAAKRARATGESLKHAVRGNRSLIAEFRVESIPSKLVDGRLGEVWEGVFAVANAASQDWLNRAMAAFIEIATDEANEEALSPRETLIRDLALAAEAVSGEAITHKGRLFLRGMVLRDELRELEEYAKMTDADLGRLMADALTGSVITVDGKTYRGYYADDLDAAWERVRPVRTADVTLVTETDPWADDAA